VPIGQYELRFAVGDYFTSQQTIPGLPFLDIVPVRFSVAEPSVAYHALGLRRLPWSLKVEPEVSAPLPYSNLRGKSMERTTCLRLGLTQLNQSAAV